jgi:hypothetical protein
MNALMGAAKYLPASVLRGALGKYDKRFNQFFSRAAAYGVDVNRAIDYLSDRFDNETQKNYSENLEKGAANQTLRPDEMVSRSQMSNQAIPGKVLKTAGSIALGGMLGSNTQEEELPPAEEPKAINPLSREGMGQDVEAQQQAQQQPQISGQEIEKAYPHLIAETKKGLAQGLSPEEVYEGLKRKPLYRGLIQKMEQSEGRPFLEKIYELIGGQRGNYEAQGPGQQGQNGQKSQFLQQLSQMSQMLQGLKK